MVDFNRLGQFAFGLVFDGNLQPAFRHGDSHDVRAELHQAQGSRLRRALRICSSAGGASLWGDFQQTGFLGHVGNTASHVPENASGPPTGDFGPRPDFLRQRPGFLCAAGQDLVRLIQIRDEFRAPLPHVGKAIPIMSV